MTNYFIYAKDYSVSTRNVGYYHENGLKTLKGFKSDVNEIVKRESMDPGETRIIYLHWGHECVEVNEEITIEKYNKRYADGNDTLPEKIIVWIKNNIKGNSKIKLLYIITDGLIRTGSLNRCLELNEDVYYENVVFHGFHQNLNSIDLSVASSFLKGHCLIYRNYELLDDVDISKEFDYSGITIDNFATEKENLKSYIKLKYINTATKNAAALTEIDKLKKLRNNLFSNLSHSSGGGINLDVLDKNIFLEEFKKTHWYKNLLDPSYDIKKDIEKSISTLINYIVCEKKSYSFDALKFDTTFRNEVPEEEIADIHFTPDQEIEFPDIILDDEKGIPVVLCTEVNLLDKLIFHTSTEEVSTASFSKFKSTMECPLFLLNDPDLNESIGYFYTLNVFKQLLEQPKKTEPRTRRPFHGGLVLVDSDDFDKYNDYILSATYFNFKKVKYNVGLFYFVLWKISEQKQWMDKNVVEQFKKYMLRRIGTTVCKIGLSSLPLDPQVDVSLPTALWYCVELSSCIFKDDTNHFVHERLRMYHGVAHVMIEILKYFNYDIDIESINKRRDLISHVMTIKRIPTRREKVYYLVNKIFKNIEGFLICDIDNVENVKKLNYLKLNHKEMLSDNVILEKVDLNDYVYFMHNIDDCEVEICDKTFRPFFVIDQNTSFYSEVYKKSQKVTITDIDGDIKLSFEPIDKLEFSRMVSLYNLFLNCVKDCNKFPTLQEYKAYILSKKKFMEDLVVIFPTNINNDIEEVFNGYERLIKEVSVSTFIENSNRYVSRVERIKAESKCSILNSDKEILRFLSEEESRVNYNKVPFLQI